jgi:hypothetical protein
MSSKSKASDKIADLMTAIQRTPTGSAAAPAPQQADSAIATPSTSSRAPQKAPTSAHKSRVGKPVQFWLHPEDQRLIRELAAWLAGQGLRPTDSMVIKSALRMAKTGGELLDAYREASQLDGRLKQHKPALV